MARKYEAVETPKQRRASGRGRIVAAGLGMLVCAVVALAFGEGLWGEGGRDVLSMSGMSEEEIRTADEEHCKSFEGFLKTECMEKRKEDRSAPRLWSDTEVRNGLWETEKALADLLVRQYKRGKEREELHQVGQGDDRETWPVVLGDGTDTETGIATIAVESFQF